MGKSGKLNYSEFSIPAKAGIQKLLDSGLRRNDREDKETDYMFIGEYSLTVDEKGRLSIPVKFRVSLSRGAVVTRGLDSALFLYTTKEWENLAVKLANLPISRANTRAFSRLMLAGAMDVEMDKAGRIILPDYLREFAVIRKKVVVAGLYNRLEIWDEDKWKKYKTTTEKTSGDIAEALEQIV